MGDFNDDATNSSFKKILETEGNRNRVNWKALQPNGGYVKKGIWLFSIQR